jgi:hypothetical protein
MGILKRTPSESPRFLHGLGPYKVIKNYEIMAWA